MQPLKILLISGNYYPEPTGIGKYNSEMINWLADNGFDCTVITTYPYYPFWKLQEPYVGKNKWFHKEQLVTSSGNKITVFRCPHYIPSRPTGKNRVLLDFSFFIFAGIKLITFAGKRFNYVMNVTPPLMLGFIAALNKNISKAKFIYHIQDLQIDVATDLNMLRSKKVINLLFSVERYILAKADNISTISASMAEKVKSKTIKPVHVFPNWANITIFYPLYDKAALKKAYGFRHNLPVILYSGSIGEKQGLEAVLEVAEVFMRKKVAIQFVICGSGPYKETLEKIAVEKRLDNFTFLPLQPTEKLNNFLNIADVHLIIQKANIADHVMPSKLTTILSVGGLVIVTANEGSGLHRMVLDNNIGLLCVAERIDALFETIKKALINDYASIRKNARLYAENFLSIDKIMLKFKTDVINING